MARPAKGPHPLTKRLCVSVTVEEHRLAHWYAVECLGKPLAEILRDRSVSSVVRTARLAWARRKR